jgi:hypothetical protein
MNFRFASRQCSCWGTSRTTYPQKRRMHVQCVLKKNHCQGPFVRCWDRAVPVLPTHLRLFTATMCGVSDRRPGCRPHAQPLLLPPLFTSWTSPRAPCAGLRDQSPVHYLIQASFFCSYIQQFGFISSTEFWNGLRHLARPWRDQCTIIVIITLMKPRQHLPSPGRKEIWPPVSGRSNGVCILITAFCWAFGFCTLRVGRRTVLNRVTLLWRQTYSIYTCVQVSQRLKSYCSMLCGEMLCEML